jgi:hypothetical protein
VISLDDPEGPQGSPNVEMGCIHMFNIKSPYDKAQRVSDTLSNLMIRYNITHVFIEENLQAFRPGLSSAKTLLTLARFNGVVSYICSQVFDSPPIFLNVNAARKSVGLKIIRKSKGGKETKHQVIEWVTSALERQGISHHWPTRILKSGPRRGQQELDRGCFDMADAYVIATAGLKDVSSGPG